ncbi:MAG: molybdate ABC transporter substrate-binding protein [Pelagimonas sp.]|nr:molybdate ABC transporter substrate-binding protein [Pelagimonas sp.]
MIIRIFAVLMAICLGTVATADSITVFAAASLRNALEDVSADFEKATGHQVVLAFAGSSALARQIQYGAPANLFISANPGWMDHLQTKGLLQDGTRRDLLTNRLALISHAEKPPVNINPDLDLGAALGAGRLAVAMVQSVPAGIYAKTALVNLGQWQSLAPKIVQTDNVRAALALVALGEAELGIVYASDAQSDPNVRLMGLFPPHTHPEIRYPVAITKSGNTPAARAFWDHLTHAQALEQFKAHGFSIAEHP